MKDVLIGIATSIGTMLLLATLGFVADYVHEKLTLLKGQVKSEALKTFIDKVDSIVRLAVEMTNQTLVDDAKKDGTFDEEAKKKAFLTTFTAVEDMLSDEDKERFAEQFGDLSTYIKANIEAYIKDSKTE